MGRGNINVTKYVRAARGRGNTMKNTRKLLALLLALILTLGCLTAWAEDLTWNGNTLDVGTVSPSSVVENPDSARA